MSTSNTPQQLDLCLKTHPHPPLNTCPISHPDTADTDPVLGVFGSPLQPLLQPCTEAAGLAELLHRLAGVAELLRGQQGLQGPQVALQGLGQRRHRLGGHGGEETQLLPQGNLQERGRSLMISAELSEIYLFTALQTPLKAYSKQVKTF